MFDLKRFRVERKISQKALADKLGVVQSVISQMESGKDPIPDTIVSKLADLYQVENITDYFIDENNKPFTQQNGRNLIPFYDDVSSIGGANGVIAETSGVSEPAEYVDAGDWFKDATAAIRHYGESMVEYPPGSILALKEVYERQLVVWGRDYVIETNEYRITKRLQRGSNEDSVRAYSTNAEIYPDGRLIHEPIDIQWKHIKHIFLVLGYVVKKNGGTIVTSSQKKKK